MANQTATDFGSQPVRQVHIGSNLQQTSMVTTISSSASDNLYMLLIPHDCAVTFVGIKASVPTGTTGNTVLKIGTPANDTLFSAGITLSGTAVLASSLTIISPITVSGSGTDALTPVVIAVNSSASTTTSLSIYLRVDTRMPGNF